MLALTVWKKYSCTWVFRHLHYCAGFVYDELFEINMHWGECN